MKPFFKHKFVRILVALIIIGSLILGGFILYGKYRIGQIPALSFQETLNYTAKNNADIVITIGIVKNGERSYTVYGENGRELPRQAHRYEIGSITKTFTAALIDRAVDDGLVDLDAGIDTYLSLPEGNHYPTVNQLLTHTAGYDGWYFARPMIANFFKGRNSFYGVTKPMVLERVGALDMDKDEYAFRYSNFGYAVLGLVLEVVYNMDYTALVNDFARQDLGLTHTNITDGNGDLGNDADWEPDDAYLSAGALVSDIDDMLSYAEMQLSDDTRFAACHEERATIAEHRADYRAMDINMDAVGMAWIMDRKNNIIWHNGATPHYNGYLGFDPATQTAVVVLANVDGNYRIPATVMGVKLMNALRK